MKKRTRKLLVTLALACAMTASVGAFASCGEEEGGSGAPVVAFLEGYLDEISLGESIQIRDYIPQEILDYKKDGKKGYTFKMQFGEQVYDLTNRATFLPEAIGTWKMILTVGKKSVEIDFEVKGKTLTWADHVKPQIEYEIGGENGTLDFAATLAAMEIEVYSDFEYETFINSVLIGSTNPTRVNLKDQTNYTFTVNDIHVFEYKTVATDGQEISGNFWAIPKTTEAKAYIKKDANYPFRDWYGGTSCGSGYLKPELATDGYYVDGISYQYTEDWDWAGLRANANLFANYFNAGAKVLKFDVYNADTVDHTYTVFHHLKKEKLPEGSEGTLKAGEWTTITITKEMFAEAFSRTREDYIPIENNPTYTDWSQHGAYGFSRPSWSSNSNYAFTVAFHNSRYVKGTPSANISFNLDNVRVYAEGEQEIKVRLLNEFNPDEFPKVMTEIEENFYSGTSGDVATDFMIMQAKYIPGKDLTLNGNSTYVLDGTTSWAWALKKSSNRQNAILGFSIDKEGTQKYNVDDILADAENASVSFAVYNSSSSNLYYDFGSGRITTGTKKLAAKSWTTVVLTKEIYDAKKTGDTFMFCVCTVDGENFAEDFSLYFDKIKINKVGEDVDMSGTIGDGSNVTEDGTTPPSGGEGGGTTPPTQTASGLEANFWSAKIDDKAVSGNESLLAICYSPFDVNTPVKNTTEKGYIKEGDSSWRVRLKTGAGLYGGMLRFSVGVDGTQENNIDDIFASGAESISFEVFTRAHSDTAHQLYYAFGNSRPNGSTAEKDALTKGDWTTITITKAEYEAAVNQNKFYLNIFAKEVLNAQYDLYFDNFQINMPQA